MKTLMQDLEIKVKECLLCKGNHWRFNTQKKNEVKKNIPNLWRRLCIILCLELVSLILHQWVLDFWFLVDWVLQFSYVAMHLIKKYYKRANIVSRKRKIYLDLSLWSTIDVVCFKEYWRLGFVLKTMSGLWCIFHLILLRIWLCVLRSWHSTEIQIFMIWRYSCIAIGIDWLFWFRVRGRRENYGLELLDICENPIFVLDLYAWVM